ncbi:MAG: endonuclease domain-containing protein [Clostridium sp.]|nr:endonuclease domain-containing protein [Clostridium sp.]
MDSEKNSPPKEGCCGAAGWSLPLEGCCEAAGWSLPKEGCSPGRSSRNSKAYFSLPFNPTLRHKARELRKAGNLSEVLLWNQLKKHKFRDFDFDRQKVIGNYIVDFFCADSKVVLEIDGSSHDEKIEYDTARDAFLEGMGLTVIHIQAKDILNNLDSVMEMLESCPFLTAPARCATPPPEGNEKK